MMAHALVLLFIEQRRHSFAASLPNHFATPVLPSPLTQLVTPRLVMRPGNIDDALTHYEAARESLELVGRWLSWCHPGMTLEDIEACLRCAIELGRSGEFFAYYLFEREGGKFVGCCNDQRNRQGSLRANLGYWIRSSRQGQDGDGSRPRSR